MPAVAVAMPALRNSQGDLVRRILNRSKARERWLKELGEGAQPSARAELLTPETLNLNNRGSYSDIMREGSPSLEVAVI